MNAEHRFKQTTSVALASSLAVCFGGIWWRFRDIPTRGWCYAPGCDKRAEPQRIWFWNAWRTGRLWSLTGVQNAGRCACRARM